ncbi:hypothetical protein FO488_11130 [Geobacter sp. FeAm09]|uniref:Ig-like domain-containing protein n=1 Tax=Geobacter sp. FeAm09 TaxID=2597769 RepID=UPI0011EBE6E1|nr:Ig-like domain-containing protein [Geobacter sp. FeAm09]QEM68656.1 hypothetical protein FO488_11130 [Geobacter sp. FeAm09]
MSNTLVSKVRNSLFPALVLAFSLVSVSFAATGNNTATITARQYVTNTVHITGGHFTTPYIAGTANTEYILDSDISADSAAIQITAPYVVINLNGHTITYNQVSTGNGIETTAYNLHDIAVTYGQIIQGTALSAGGSYGLGNNPISTKYKGADRTQIAGIYAKYGGQDVGGFQLGGDYVTVENSTVEDVYNYGTVTDRHSGISAIHLWGWYGTVRNNTIINTRDKGVEAGYTSNVYGNTISILSICTNSVGIGISSNSKIYNNTIVGRGEMPVGIALGSSTPKGFVTDPAEIDATYVPQDVNNPNGYNHDIEVYGNTIDVQVTRLGVEYSGGVYPGASTWSDSGVWAVGIRSTTGIVNLSVHDNTITATGNYNFQGTWSPTGQAVTMGSMAKGIMLGLRWSGHSASIYNNTVTALDNDGTGSAIGISICANIDNRYFYTDPSQPRRSDFHPNLAVYGNTVTSNILNLALGDDYGPSDGFPLVYRNTFIKSGSYSRYHTIGVGYGTYYEISTGLLLSNVYQNGAAESDLGFNFDSLSNGNAYRGKAVIFGRLMSGTVKDTGSNLLPNIRTTVYTGTTSSFGVQLATVTDATGAAPLYVYDYELNNAGGTTGKATPTTVTYRPHTNDLYNLATSQDMFTTTPDTSASSWDAVTSSGTYTLVGTGGSITISAASGTGTTTTDTTAPAIAITAPAAGATVSGNVSVTVNTSDNVGVAKVEYYVNGTLLTTTTSSPYSYTWNTASVSNGSSTLSAKAYDAAGNVGTSTSVAVTVSNAVADTTVPTAALTAPTSNATVSGTVTVTATASDNVGVSRVDFYVNGTLRASVNSSPYSFSWNTTADANGSYSLYAKAYDAAGNSAATSTITVTVNNVVADTTAPTVSAFSIPATATSLTVAVSSFTATDNVAVTGYLVTESATAPSASATGWSSKAPASFTFSAAGSKTAYAWAKDAAGNVSAAKSGSVTITLADTTAPTVSAFSIPATATSLTVAVSSFAATDNVAVTGYLVTESATAPSASATGWSSTVPTSFTFSAAGSKTAYAWAKDAAGNVSAARSGSVTITLATTTTTSYTVSDALLALRIASGKVTPTSAQLSSLDVAPVVNGQSVPDGTINTGDVIVIMSKIVGKTIL